MVRIGFWRLVIVLVVTGSIMVPGLVEGSGFVGGSGTSALTGTATPYTSSQCGFSTGENEQDSGFVTTITTTGANTYGAFYSAVQFTLKTEQLGSGGYEYLDGEFDIGCYSTMASPRTTVISISIAGSTTNVGWAVTAVEKLPSAVTTAPTTTYCTPGTKAPTTQTGACGAAAGIEASCGLSNPTYYLPNDWQSGTTANWYTKDITGGTSPCGSLTTITPSAGIHNQNTYLGIVSFAIGSASSIGTPTSTAWALTMTVTVS
jgi:hypothetical protein